MLTKHVKKLIKNVLKRLNTFLKEIKVGQFERNGKTKGVKPVM